MPWQPLFAISQVMIEGFKCFILDSQHPTLTKCLSLSLSLSFSSNTWYKLLYRKGPRKQGNAPQSNISPHVTPPDLLLITLY